MDRLLDENEHVLFNLVTYYYSPKPPPIQSSLSRSNSSSSSNSPPPQSQPQQSNDKKYTLQEQQLCTKIASFTGMHVSHIFESYDEVKSLSIDTFTINEAQV